MAHRWRGACALLLTLLALSLGDSALAWAQRGDGGAQPWPSADNRQHCWRAPTPATVEEALKVTANPTLEERSQLAGRAGGDRDVLLISGDTLKAAYAAGLLVGWSETGTRPQFAAVTGVGMSALIAPFAFIGPSGDQAIADIFNCSSPDATEMAARAASYLDDEVLDRIAREHDSGRRLIIALPGSAAHPEAVWDVGRIAGSRHPGAAALVRQVLLAAVDQHTFVNPRNAPIKAGKLVARNFAFRTPGAGEPFLVPPEVAQFAGPGTFYHLIHNQGIFPDESADFIRDRKSADTVHQHPYEILPAYDIVRHAMTTNSRFRFASIKVRLGLIPQESFDMDYLRALFEHAYRQGRMGKEWRSNFPGLLNVAPDPPCRRAHWQTNHPTYSPPWKPRGSSGYRRARLNDYAFEVPGPHT